MTDPVSTAPSVSETPPDEFLFLVEALANASTIAQLVSVLASLPGISLGAVDALFELQPGFAKDVLVLPVPPSMAPPAVVRTARLNLVRRAQYLANAARRVTSAATEGRLREAIEREGQHFQAHKEASANRDLAADRVVKAAKTFGPVLGWHATLDSKTSPECRAANGTNFPADRIPAIGYPGAVHTHCRCRPGRPFATRRRSGDDPGSILAPRPTGENVVAAVNNYPADSELIELARASGSLRSMAGHLGVSRPSLTNYLLRRPILNAAVRVCLRSNAAIELATDHKSSTHPDPPNKPGVNWVEQEGGLPPFIKRVAKHIMSDSGYSQQRAIAAAISQCKKGRLGPKGLAAAAQWEALKAKAHSHSNPDGPAVELATYSSSQLSEYYQKPAGSQAKTKGAKAPGGKKKVVRTEAGARRYGVPIGSEIGKARNASAAEAQQNSGAVDRYKKTVGAPDRDQQVAALNPKDLGDLSRVAFSFKSADPNVVALRTVVVRELTKRGMDPRMFGYLGGSGKSTAKKVVAKTPARKVATIKKPAPAPKPAKGNFGRIKVQ